MRAVHDFDPKEMSSREKCELQEILELKRGRRKMSMETQVVEDLIRSEDQLDKEKSGQSKKSILMENERDSRLVGIITEEQSIQYEETQNQEENIETEQLEMHIRKEELITCDDQEIKSGADESSANSDLEDDVDISAVEQKHEDQRTRSRDSGGTYNSEDEAIPFSRGDKMETITPENIG